MIIFGTRGVTFTPEKGEFFCPGCCAERSFARKSVRRFFTLYFIPLVPLDKLGETKFVDTVKKAVRRYRGG